MLTQKNLILLGVAVIVVVIIYFLVLSNKWVDVEIKHYNGKVLAGQAFDPASLTGTEKRRGRKVRAYFAYHEYIGGVYTLQRDRPVVKAYLNDYIMISHKEKVNEKSVEMWTLSSSLDGNMIDVIPGEGKIIEGNSHSVKGWTIEWWRHPTKPVKVIIITNPNGKSRTFRIEWTPK